jgi:hypothetical protein
LGPGPHRPWAALGTACAILGGAYLTGINRNLLYLSLLFSAAVVMSVALRRWWTVMAGLAACAFLASVPAKVADLGPLYPAPRDRPGTENMWVSAIGQGATWTYRFTPGGSGKFAGGAGLAGFLYIDGRNLSGLVVRFRGGTLMGSAYCAKKNGFDHVAIPLGDDEAGPLTVSLSGAPGTVPKIYHGPEVHGFDVYGDAVWLEFTGDKGRFIYEAKRSEAPSGPR